MHTFMVSARVIHARTIEKLERTFQKKIPHGLIFLELNLVFYTYFHTKIETESRTAYGILVLRKRMDKYMHFDAICLGDNPHPPQKKLTIDSIAISAVRDAEPSLLRPSASRSRARFRPTVVAAAVHAFFRERFRRSFTERYQDFFIPNEGQARRKRTVY